MPQPTIGFIGVGAMGGGMARCLIRAGFPLLAFDPDPQRLSAIASAGGKPADALDALVDGADVVMTSLPTPEVWRDVAENHLLPRCRGGQVFIDAGTSTIADTRRLAGRFAERGATLLDAPVSGGERGANEGKLYVFIGGPRETFEQCLPIFHAIGHPDHVNYCGPSGCGQIVKVVNQMAMGLYAAAFLESLAYGVQMGIDAPLLHKAVGGEDGFRRLFAQIADKVIAGQGRDIGIKAGQLPHFLDDLKAWSLAQGQDARLPMTAALVDFLKDAELLALEANRPSPSFWHELIEKHRA